MTWLSTDVQLLAWRDAARSVPMMSPTEVERTIKSLEDCPGRHMRSYYEALRAALLSAWGL